tara:strand:- start:322 stop:582 length:261 start_codon:yes stop_codon:yes gene_type:complete
MSDSVKKWYETIEEEALQKEIQEQHNVHITEEIFVWVLDHEDGNVYCYNKWNPDTMSCEDFLTAVGHSITDCEWMVNKNKNVNYII